MTGGKRRTALTLLGIGPRLLGEPREGQKAAAELRVFLDSLGAGSVAVVVDRSTSPNRELDASGYPGRQIPANLRPMPLTEGQPLGFDVDATTPGLDVPSDSLRRTRPTTDFD